jgi:hypothetical protein
MRTRLMPIPMAFLFTALLLIPSWTGDAQSAIQIIDTGPKINFPEGITFRAQISSDAPIQSVVLEYGIEQLTCGTVVAKAFPEFKKEIDTSAGWTWEMRQSGSLPPGAKIWWRWHVTDDEGRQGVSQRETVTWLDDIHEWEIINADNISLHWYEGDIHFGENLHTAAVKAINWLNQEAGLSIESPIELYIYGSPADLREAVLYEPSWIGGQAFAAQDIVIMAVPPYDLEWGERVIAHELTHVLVGHYTFSCLGDVPAWLDEGLASFSEGDLEPYSKDQLAGAVRRDMLIPLRALSGAFSEEPDKADLSYSESFSVVNFLIKEHGQAKMNQLLIDLREGETIDAALLGNYGFDMYGLEDVWRSAIGAVPRAQAEYNSTPRPTLVPTFKPVSGLPVSPSTPTLLPTASLSAEPTKSILPMEAPESGPPSLWMFYISGGICLVLLLFGAILLIVLRRWKA